MRSYHEGYDDGLKDGRKECREVALESLTRPDVVKAVAEMLGDYCPMYNLLGRKVLAQNVIRTAIEAAREEQGK